MYKNTSLILLFCLTTLKLGCANTELIISNAMSFNMNSIVDRYKKEFQVTDEVAKEHERELKRYLALCAIYPEQNFHMFSNSVDNLWHTFLIFTKDYKNFCKNVAGKFLHHVPIENKSEEDVSAKNKFIDKYSSTFNEKPSTTIWSTLESSNGADCNPDYCSNCQSGCLVR